MMEYQYFEDKKYVDLKKIPDFVIDKLKSLDGNVVPLIRPLNSVL